MDTVYLSKSIIQKVMSVSQPDDYGLVFAGSTDSGFYHNVVVNTKYGVRYLDGGGRPTARRWDKPSR